MDTSITNPDYKLPHIYPTNLDKELETGANKPLILRGVDMETGIKKECVVKLQASERMTPYFSMKELLACFIAKELGLEVISPVIVRIDEQTVEIARGLSYCDRIGNSIGLNFGSEYLQGFYQISEKEPLSLSQQKDAVEIFIFDMMIQNPDRNKQKPNMLMGGDRITILDHELAFSFLDVFSFLRPSPIFALKKTDNLVEKHYLLKHLTLHNLDDVQILDNLDKLNISFWNKAKELIPDNWLSPKFDEIKVHFDLLNRNRNEFYQELKKICL